MIIEQLEPTESEPRSGAIIIENLNQTEIEPCRGDMIIVIQVPIKRLLTLPEQPSTSNFPFDLY